MKTRFFLFAGLAIMLFTCRNLQAQIKYGIHTGLNLETQAEMGQLWNNKEIYQGFLIGGFLEYPVGNKISLQTELNYQKKGEKYNNSATGIKTITRRDFNYLSIPLLVKGTFGKDLGLGNKWDVTGFTGPYYGYLTSADSDIKIGDTTKDVDIDNQVEKNDWGFVFGGGVSYNLTNGGAIVTELRYEMGLGKIDKQNPDLRNKVIGLSIGYRF
ncbi:MAG: PorT family protein [Bacteroidales bacterium]|nr:PorT family protein [Bacteroidales bacterium]